MKRFVIPISALLILPSVMVADAQEKGNRTDSDSIVWGKAVNGLQLGISPPFELREGKAELFDGTNLCINVHLRNVSQAPIRLLPSIYHCLAFGDGGANLVTHLILQPNNGGDSLTVSYQGWNHLLLLDKRRPKSESWQETLCKSDGGETEVQLDNEDADDFSVVLAASESRWDYVTYTPGKDSKSVWRLTDESKSVQAGNYQVAAVLIIDQKRSDWKGKLTSGPLQVEIRPQDKK